MAHLVHLKELQLRHTFSVDLNICHLSAKASTWVQLLSSIRRLYVPSTGQEALQIKILITSRHSGRGAVTLNFKVEKGSVSSRFHMSSIDCMNLIVSIHMIIHNRHVADALEAAGITSLIAGTSKTVK